MAVFYILLPGIYIYISCDTLDRVSLLSWAVCVLTYCLYYGPR